MLTLPFSDASSTGKLFPELGPMLYIPSAEEQAEGSTTSSSCSPPTQLLPITSGTEVTATPCTQCQLPIHDRYILFLDAQPFHPTCLRCSFCFSDLTHDPACVVKDGQVICKTCYPMLEFYFEDLKKKERFRKYRRTCLRCGVVLLSDEYVMRARDAVFHLNCFTCCICGTQLNSGETFAMNEQSDLFCQLHTQLNIPPVDSAGKQRSEDSEEQDEEHPPQSRSKRMRTSFKHHQLKAMKLYFTLNHNPDAKDLKQLAQKTGLTKRVLQVWFQNARAKYRRSMQGRDPHALGLAGPVSSAESSSSGITPKMEFDRSPKYEPESPEKLPL